MWKRICIFLTCVALALPATETAAQDTDSGRRIDAAIRLMDDELYDESEELLQSVLAAEPDNYRALYEMGFLHYKKKDYGKAVELVTSTLRLPDVQDAAYQLLGNSYDYMGNPKKAVATYKKGLKRFPASGRLNLELGNMAYNAEEFDEALACYEQGIAAEPSFPSNYFNAAALFFSSSEPIWGLLYGEIFMNLERNTGRTRTMGKALYDAYRKAVVIGEEGGTRKVNYSFTKNNTVFFGKSSYTIPFPVIYGLVVEDALPKDAVAVDVPTLDTMRRAFVAKFFDEKDDANYCRRYSNALYEYQHRMAREGHLEAYNYWLLRDGDPEAFDTWYESHRDAWEDFVDWFNGNRFEIDSAQRYSRQQYNDVSVKL